MQVSTRFFLVYTNIYICIYNYIYILYKHLCHSVIRLLEFFAMGLIRPGPSRRWLERRWFLLVPFMLHPLMFALPKDSCLTPWLRAMSIYHDRMIQFTFCTMFSECFLLYGPCYSGMLEHCRYNIILYHIILWCYIILYYDVILYYVILYYIMLCYVILYYVIFYYIILYYIIYIILYYIILYYIILYYIILYYIILNYIILY